MFFLPKDLQRYIFTFDSTYHEHYRIVMKQLKYLWFFKTEQKPNIFTMLKKI